MAGVIPPGYPVMGNRVDRALSLPNPFATVRLRTTAAKRFRKVENATAVIWKILQVAESTFRRLKGAELLPAVYAGAQYVDGVQPSTSRQQKIAA